MPTSLFPLRRHVLLTALCALVLLLFLYTSTKRDQLIGVPNLSSHALASHDHFSMTGHAIAPKLGNETAKAELGRAAWKVLHTIMARFPDQPTADESAALKTFIYLFQRLYPCGECAQHFGELLKRFPPQVSSRSTAAVWACHVHNQVNARLKKDMFDCAKIGDFYDCGCADGHGKSKSSAGAKNAHGKATVADGEQDEMLLTDEGVI